MLVVAMIASKATAAKIKEKNVPQIVKDAFQKQFPGATEVEWEMENGSYEAEFDLNEVDHSALINTSGQIMETEVEIETAQLPAMVQDYLKSAYSGKKVKEAFMITDANNKVTYEVEIKGKELLFDGQGKLLSTSKD